MVLEAESRPLTAFVTPWGLFQWTVLPMGLETAPQAYQRMSQLCLEETVFLFVRRVHFCGQILERGSRSADPEKVAAELARHMDPNPPESIFGVSAVVCILH